MTIKVTTETGSVYEIDLDEQKMRRIPQGESGPLRKDNEWLKLLVPPTIELNQPLRMAIEPLSVDANVTMRFTSHVVSIEDEVDNTATQL